MEACARKALVHTNHDALAQILADSAVEVSEAVTAKLGRSLHVRHLDAGSCNACDFELGAMSNPVYDLHRYGIAFVASPRHADMLMVTGVVTRNLEQALRMTMTLCLNRKWLWLAVPVPVAAKPMAALMLL